MNKVGNTITVSFLVAAGLSACAATVPESPGRAHLTQEQILAEYAAETSRLELAVGDKWVTTPSELTLDSPDLTRPMQYEEGVGAQTAQFQWYCSWARHALAAPDPALSLERLEEFPSMVVWNDMDSTGHRLFTQILEAADAGDLGPLAGYVSASCPRQ